MLTGLGFVVQDVGRCLGFCLGFGMSSETGLSVLRGSSSQ